MSINLSDEQLERFGIKPPKKKSKYRSKKVPVDGISFDSQAEADYYCHLKLMLRAGKIAGFCRQARFVVTEGINGAKGTEYVTDFVIFYHDGRYRIVDVKGYETEAFKLKMKCMKEKYPKITVELEK